MDMWFKNLEKLSVILHSLLQSCITSYSVLPIELLGVTKLSVRFNKPFTDFCRILITIHICGIDKTKSNFFFLDSLDCLRSLGSERNAFKFLSFHLKITYIKRNLNMDQSIDFSFQFQFHSPENSFFLSKFVIIFIWTTLKTETR